MVYKKPMDILENETLTKLKNMFGHYESDPDYVFKTTAKAFIVLKKCKYTRTNERRAVINTKFAKYRASLLHVVCIVNRHDPDKTLKKTRSTFSPEFVYIVGKDVVSKCYDKNYNNIYSDGIHYFKSIERAFYSHLNKTKMMGINTLYCDNGGFGLPVALMDILHEISENRETNDKIGIEITYKNKGKNIFVFSYSQKKWIDVKTLLKN